MIKTFLKTMIEIYFAVLAPQKEEWMNNVLKKSQESSRSCPLGD